MVSWSLELSRDAKTSDPGRKFADRRRKVGARTRKTKTRHHHPTTRPDTHRRPCTAFPRRHSLNRHQVRPNQTQLRTRRPLTKKIGCILCTLSMPKASASTRSRRLSRAASPTRRTLLVSALVRLAPLRDDARKSDKRLTCELQMTATPSALKPLITTNDLSRGHWAVRRTLTDSNLGTASPSRRGTTCCLSRPAALRVRSATEHQS